MSKESFARGWVKAAEAAGVDPVFLAKFTNCKVAQSAQQSADLAALRQKFAPVSAKLKSSPKGTTVQWTPDQIAAFNAYRKKHGDISADQLMQ